jgi:hypothetical protein
MGKSTISIAIFNSYVKLPEGILGVHKYDAYMISYQKTYPPSLQPSVLARAWIPVMVGS